jgi:hypothetical protein
MVDGKIPHGGLADRLYGIMSTYAVCKIMAIPFKLYWTYPFSIHVFLIPNEYDWSIQNGEIVYNRQHSKPMIRIQEKYWYKKIKTKKQVHFYCNTRSLKDINRYYNSNFTYNELFNELFKPSKLLQNKIDNIMHIIKRPYVGMHFRFSSSLGEFNDVVSLELSDLEKKKLLELGYRTVLYIASKDDAKIFLTSDSLLFLDYISKKTDKVFYIPGTIAHLDLNSSELPEVHEKTFLDFYMLGYAAKIYNIYSQRPGLYKSGYSLFASNILGAEFEAVDADSL